MKYSLRLLLFLGGWLLLGNPLARASHAQGGQLTYEYVGTAAQPNRYRVTCRFLRDCTGIDAPTSLTLNCRVGTPINVCTSNDSRNFTATLTRGILTAGTPYCTSAGNTCGTTGRPNYETAKYEAVVTLPPAASWTLSVQENARPALANVTGNAQDLYLEATLNNQITLVSGTTQTINNTSAQYFDQQVPTSYVCYQQRNTVSFLATEPDGDSLVYTLPAVQEGCNTPMTYKPTSFTNTPIIDPSSTPQNPCLIYPTGLPQNFSPAYPIASYDITGNCPARQATALFQFNSRQGTFTFRPTIYDATNAANNRYTVVGKVTEYRRINGRYYLVGSVRRDIPVIVMDCGTNTVPGAVSSLSPSTPAPDSLVVSAPYLGSSNVNFTFADANPADVLTVTHTLPTDPVFASLYTNPSVPGQPVTITNNGSGFPVLQVRLRPDADAIGRTFRIPVRVEDNACPAKGVQNFVLVLRVTGNATATRPAAARTVRSAYPNPFSEQVHFSLPRRAGAVDIVDQLGRVVDHLAVPAGAGAEAKLTWTPAATLPAGVYTARSADGTQVVRLVRVAP